MIKAKHVADGVRGYSAIKGAISAVTKPVTWIRDQVRDAIIGAAVKIAVKLVGERVANTAVGKITDLSKDFEFNVPVPAKIRKSIVEEAETDRLIEELANDALKAPLALLGLSVGTLRIERNEDCSSLKFCMNVKIDKAENAEKEKGKTVKTVAAQATA